MGKVQVEDYEEILQRVKEIVQEENAQDFKPIPAKELMQEPMKNPVVELEPDDFNLPSATCVIDFGLLHIFKPCRGEDKIMAFDIWWGCVYPEKQLFILEFWEAEPNTTGKIFEMYLTSQNIKFLIKILQKGLEYLKKYGQNEQAK